MVVQYDVTVPDMVRVMRRAALRSEPKLGWRWKQKLLVSALLTAFFCSAIEGSASTKTIASAIFFGVVFAGMTYLYGSRVAEALERHVVRQYGPSSPFTFEIEISAAGMTTRQLGEEIRREWSTVEDVTDTTGGIEFGLKRGGLVFVRDTGFSSPDARAEFLRLAKQYMCQ